MAVDAAQAASAHGGLDPHQFAQRHDVAERASPPGVSARASGRVPFAGAQDHVEAPFAVEVFADEHAVAERAHHRADVAARPAHFVQAAIVGVEAQLGLGHFQALERLDLRAGHLFLDELLGMAGRCQQRREVRGLELEVDVAAVTETAEQVALRRERLRVGKADQRLLR